MKTQTKLIEKVDVSLLSTIPSDAAVAFRALPLGIDNGRVCLATCRDLDPAAINDLRFILGGELLLLRWPKAEIEAALEHFHLRATENSDDNGNDYRVIEKAQQVSKTDKSCEEGHEFSVVQTVNEVVSKAIRQRASDIHIEPYEHEFRVRFRLDGVLHNRESIDLLIKSAVVARLKIMADLDIAEKRRPQDGRIRVTNGEKTIDIRVSTLPIDFGEKVVLRILDKKALNLDLNSLGLDAEESTFLRDAVSASHGMVLVTGPTGSGKTTTLYATLNHLNSEGVNILTIEDPIEYNLPGINQAHMRADIGFTFARALKTFLRQDPDIIMVGEIRDYETAEMAVRAALTGHLVLSTLHTNDAPSAVARLVDMGIEPFLIASCTRLVVAQRLVRKICTFCKREIGLPHSSLPANLETEWNMATAFEGSGCEKCYHTGYRGRTALFEMMPVNEVLGKLITSKTTSFDLKDRAIKQGMKTLRTSGVLKVRAGTTTPEEVLRETGR